MPHGLWVLYFTSDDYMSFVPVMILPTMLVAILGLLVVAAYLYVSSLKRELGNHLLKANETREWSYEKPTKYWHLSMHVQETEPCELVISMNGTPDGTQSSTIRLGHSPSNPNVLTAVYQVDQETIQSWRFVGTLSDINIRLNHRNTILTLVVGSETITMQTVGQPAGNILRISSSHLMMIHRLRLYVF
jgi:hypothetical protein